MTTVLLQEPLNALINPPEVMTETTIHNDNFLESNDRNGYLTPPQ